MRELMAIHFRHSAQRVLIVCGYGKWGKKEGLSSDKPLGWEKMADPGEKPVPKSANRSFQSGEEWT